MAIEDLNAVARAAQESGQLRRPPRPVEEQAPPPAAPAAPRAQEELELSGPSRQIQAREELEQSLEGVVSTSTGSAEPPRSLEALKAREQLQEGLQDIAGQEAPAAEAEVGQASEAQLPPRAPEKGQGTLPPTLWNEHAVNTVNQKGLEQGSISQEQIDRNTKLAEEHGARGGGLDLASLAREVGVEPARLDPNQLEAARRYVEDGDPAQQSERLRKALNNFNVLDQGGPPKMSRQETNDLMWGVARVPGHATQKLDEQGLSQTFQEVAAAVASPGQHKLKVGQHTLEMKVNQSGQVTESETKAPSALSKIGGFLKTAIPVAATVAAFIPGVGTAVAAGLRIASAAISGVSSIKDGNFLGALGAVAGGVGAGFSLGSSAVAARVASMADSVGAGSRGVQSIKQGGVLGVVGGVAGVAGAAAGLSGLDDAGKVQDISGKVSTTANRVETAQRFRTASGAVEQAEQQLTAARATGDAAAIARAEQQLDEARRLKQTALLAGLGTAAEVGAAHTSGEASNALGYASSGLDLTADLKNKDYLGAAASATGIAARASGSQSLQDASRVADQSNNFRLASQAEGRARQALQDAERNLRLARSSGDPEAVRQAEQALSSAREQRDFAQSNSYFAGDQMARTGQAIGQRIETDRRFQANMKELQPSLDQARQASEQLEAAARNPRATGGFQDLAAEARAGLQSAEGELADALASGDKGRIAEARGRFEAASAQASERARLIEAAVAPAALPTAGLATSFTLPPGQPPVQVQGSPTSSSNRVQVPRAGVRPPLATPQPTSEPSEPGRVSPSWVFDESRYEIPASGKYVLGPDGRPYDESGQPIALRPVAPGDYREAGMRLLEHELSSNLPNTTDRRRPQDVLALVMAARGGDNGGPVDQTARETIRQIVGRELTAQEYGDLDHYIDGWTHVEATPAGGALNSLQRGASAVTGSAGYVYWTALKGYSQLRGGSSVAGAYQNNENTSRANWQNYNSYNVGAIDALKTGYPWDAPEKGISYWDAVKASWGLFWGSGNK